MREALLPFPLLGEKHFANCGSEKLLVLNLLSVVTRAIEFGNERDDPLLEVHKGVGRPCDLPCVEGVPRAREPAILEDLISE